MPGLSQLKQFEKDILSLGDEITLRASRGEKPVKVPIPKTIKVDNDAEDFVLGMPEVPLEKKASVVDDDLSDITGGGSKASTSSSSEEVVEQGGPDLSSLLAPVVDFSSESGGDDSGMPDLSMFMDEPEPEVQEEAPQEEEPQEISVADIGLDALLAGAGFDGSEGAGFEEAPKSDSDDYLSDFDNGVVEEDKIFDATKSVSDKAPQQPVEKEPEPQIPASTESSAGFDMPDELKAIFGMNQPAAEEASAPEPSPYDIPSIPETPSFDEPSGAAAESFDMDFGSSDFGSESVTPAVTEEDDFSVPDNFDILANLNVIYKGSPIEVDCLEIQPDGLIVQLMIDESVVFDENNTCYKTSKIRKFLTSEKFSNNFNR